LKEEVFLSVVIPCFNEEEVLPVTITRLKEILRSFSFSSEVIFVDDGSKDKTWQIIKKTNQEDSRFKGLRLSRNFGHQYALTCGLFNASGEIVAVLDADLQDPPELIPAMIDKLQSEGVDIVYGKRRKRLGEPFLKRLFAYLFYRFVKKISGLAIPEDTGDFRVISRRALDAFLNLPERHRFVRGMFAWIGFSQLPMYYDRPPRAAGSTKYPFIKSLAFALDAIVSFSKWPLRVASVLGFLIAGLSFVYIIVVIILFLFGINFPGYTSLMASILFLGGVQLLALGILGEYIGRIYEQTQQRPLFIVKESIGHFGNPTFIK
jgi:dolichol-phosphate mannosyltransferase